MSTPLYLDTPIGPITAPGYYTRRARACTDQELADKLNAEGISEPSHFIVAVKERPHLSLDENGDWAVRESSFGGRPDDLYTLADVVRETIHLLMRHDYGHVRLGLTDEDRGLLDVLEYELRSAGGPVPLGRLRDAAREHLDVDDKWRTYDAIKFMRRHDVVRCVGRVYRNLPQSLRYVWNR